MRDLDGILLRMGSFSGIEPMDEDVATQFSIPRNVLTYILETSPLLGPGKYLEYSSTPYTE